MWGHGVLSVKALAEHWSWKEEKQWNHLLHRKEREFRSFFSSLPPPLLPPPFHPTFLIPIALRN